MDPISLAATLGTKGANSPISLTGAPHPSQSNPVVTVSTGGITFGGGAFSSTASSDGLPTPNKVFGQPALTAALGNPVLLAAVGFILFAVLKHRGIL